MEKVFKVVSLHRLRTGETVQLYLSANMGLYQIVNSKAKTALPDWSLQGNHPVITPTLVGANILEPKWYANGQEISENNDIYSVDRDGVLTITKCPVTSFTSLRNIDLTFKCKAAIGGQGEPVERTITILVHEGGSNSYWGQISAPGGTVLGEILEGDTLVSREDLFLKPELWCGDTKVENFTVEWRRSGTGADGTDEVITSEYSQTVNGLALAEDKKLHVWRNGVDGMAHFECHFFVGGQPVEAEGIQIVDNADEYFIGISGETNIYKGGTAQIQATVYKTLTNEEVPSARFSATVTDGVRMGEYDRSRHFSITDEGLFKMKEEYMHVPNTDKTDWLEKPWLKCGASSAEDVKVADVKEATECDVQVIFVATI